MDLESESSVIESVEDNEVTKNDSFPEELRNWEEGSCVVEDKDDDTLVKEDGTEAWKPLNSPLMDLKPEGTPSPEIAVKGFGLKKWRRIKKGADRVRGTSIVSGMVVIGVPLDTAQASSKRAQDSDRNINSEVAASSSNAWARGFHGLDPLHNLEPGLPQFTAGTDSESSDDRSSRSTAASAPNIEYQRQNSVGFSPDESRTRRSGGKNIASAVHRGQHQQGKGRFGTTKKDRGERVKIEKENSHSSLESDSRSSNFMSMQGAFSTNNYNGLLRGNQRDSDEENFSEVRGDDQVSDDARDGAASFEDLSPEDTAAESSSEVKEVRHSSSSVDQDPLVQSIFELKSVQEALGKEILKFKEIREEISNDNFEDHGEKLESCSPDPQSELVEIAGEGVATELEESLFRRIVEADVEYLAMSGTVHRLKADTEDQITMLKEQNTLDSEQANQLRDADSQGAMLRDGTKKLEVISEDIARDDETVELQERVCKYSLLFLLQLALLVVIIGVIVSRLWPTNAEIVPT